MTCRSSLRSAEQMRAMAALEPFAADELAASKGKPQVMLLAQAPSAAARRAALALAPAGDRFVFEGAELHWLPSSRPVRLDARPQGAREGDRPRDGAHEGHDRADRREALRGLSGAARRRPLAARLNAQLLAGEPARDAVAVAQRLLAVQGQDPRGARLAVRARTLGSGTSAADVDRALTDERALLISWLNRGTLHLVRSDDYGWLHALTTPPLLTGCARRLAQEGVPPVDVERGVQAIERALADEGPLTREQLRDRIAAAGVRTEGQALVHLLMARIAAGPLRARPDGRR